VAWGAKAAAEYVTQMALALDSRLPAHWSVTPGTLSVTLSRSGLWARNVETDNGTETITVRRATPEQEAAWRAAELTGETLPPPPAQPQPGKKLATRRR
jgi:hypothetical protein